MQISKRVTNGIAWFDEFFPDWLDNFTTNEFDLYVNSSNLHPVAIITGIDFNFSMREKLETREGWLWCYQRGFVCLWDEAELNEEWKGQIQLLRLARTFVVGGNKEEVPHGSPASSGEPVVSTILNHPQGELF